MSLLKYLQNAADCRVDSELCFLSKQAQVAYDEHRDYDCLKILRMMAQRHPQSAEVMAALACAYTNTGHTGNAVKIWEKLYESDRGNSSYSFELAEAYLDRGWYRKGLSQYNRTKFLDPDNASAWEGMIDCYTEAREYDIAEQTCYEAISALKERGLESAELYVRAFDYNCSLDNTYEAAEEYLKSVVALIKDDNDLPKEEFNKILLRLIVTIKVNYAYEMLPYIRELVETAGNVHQTFLNTLQNLETDADFEALDESYPELIHSLLSRLINDDEDDDDDDDERNNDITSIECSILADFEGYHPHLIRLSEEYPRLYALHEIFFGTVTASVSREEMLQHRLKLLSDRQLRPNLLSADGKEIKGIRHPDTYRRNGPKIGRNAPCPCGSGKKYKKCCIA